MYAIFKDRFGQDVPAYSVYLLLGIVAVGYFSMSTRFLMPLFVTNKLTFMNATVPRETFFLSVAVVQLYKFAIELAFCVVLSLAYGVFSWSFFILLWPLLVAFTALSLGVGVILALVFSVVRDMEHIWTLATRLLLFVTPVFYQVDISSTGLGKATYWLNPLTPFLVAFRGITMGDTNFSPLV